MAVTTAAVGDLPYYIDGANKVTYTDVTMDSDYLTGGEVVTLQQLRLAAVQHAEAQITVAANATDSLGAVNTIVDHNNGLQRIRLRLYDKDVPAEIDGSDNLANCVIRVVATGY